MMIPYAVKRGRPIVELNKKVYICFVLAFVMLAASPMRAADSPVSPAPEPPEHKTIVVRADPRTGRLVRIVVASPRGENAARKKPSANIAALIEQTARAHDVDPLLVKSMIRSESNYDQDAISPKGAEGLMQLMPSTARMMGVANSFDAAQNIEGGVKYLKYLQSVYKDDRLALAAYNAGPGAVDRYSKSIPPYRETQDYVDQVGKRYNEARRAATAKTAAPPEPAAPLAAVPLTDAQASTDQQPDPPEEQHPRLSQFVDEHGRLHLRTLQ